MWEKIKKIAASIVSRVRVFYSMGESIVSRVGVRYPAGASITSAVSVLYPTGASIVSRVSVLTPLAASIVSRVRVLADVEDPKFAMKTGFPLLSTPHNTRRRDTFDAAPSVLLDRARKD
jgi:hypothetical protein